jgi:transcriptional regulator GlxA family with amidase domain
MNIWLRDSLTALLRDAPTISADQFGGAAKIAGQLVALALVGQADVGSQEPSIRAGNLARAKTVMRRELTNCELTLQDVATKCGISLRYLHKLFGDDESSAQTYLRTQRLSRAMAVEYW